jgi:long-chain acyl-CoA synthetase
MNLNLGSILQASADARPEHPAIRLGERTLTYAALDRAARGVATGLRERGISPGDTVALLVPNVPEFTIAYFGILYAGATVVPLNVLLSAPEVTYHLEDSDAKLLVAHPLFGDPVREGAAEASVPVVWVGGEGEDGLDALAARAPADTLHATGPTDTAVILYTSGTTGKPKGAELTHANLLLNCAVVVPRLIAIGADDVALATLPLFHSFGQTCIQNASIAAGGTFTLLPRFTPQEAFEIMERDRVTIFAGVPTMYFALLHHEGDRAYDLSALRFCMAGGSAMPVEVMKAFEQKYPVEILEGYGLSETSPVASFNMLDRPRKPGSIGYPVWGVEMAILDDNDRPVADGEPGEICIRGHNIMKGYRGPQEGHDHPRWLQRVPARGGGGAVRPPGDPGGGRDRRSPREPRRGGEGDRGAEALCRSHGRGRRRLLQGTAGGLQVPAHRRVLRGAAQGPDGQDPQARAQLAQGGRLRKAADAQRAHPPRVRRAQRRGPSASDERARRPG